MSKEDCRKLVGYQEDDLIKVEKDLEELEKKVNQFKIQQLKKLDMNALKHFSCQQGSDMIVLDANLGVRKGLGIDMWIFHPEEGAKPSDWQGWGDFPFPFMRHHSRGMFITTAPKQAWEKGHNHGLQIGSPLAAGMYEYNTYDEDKGEWKGEGKF